MFKILYRLLSLRFIRKQINQLLYFYLIINNFKKKIRGQVKYSGASPISNQRVFLTGNGNIEFGQNCVLGYKIGGFHYKGCIEIQPRYQGSQIKIGNYVEMNNNVFICSANSIEIGDYTLIGQQVTLMDFEAHNTDPEKRKQLGPIGKIEIGENVWIGNNALILKNTIIGKNSIVAAGSVVSGIFPANVMIGGVPAKIIKNIDSVKR